MKLIYPPENQSSRLRSYTVPLHNEGWNIKLWYDINIKLNNFNIIWQKFTLTLPIIIYRKYLHNVYIKINHTHKTTYEINFHLSGWGQSWRRHKRVAVNATGCGFDSHSIKWNIYYFNFFAQSAENGKRRALTLDSHVPSAYPATLRDTAWS